MSDYLTLAEVLAIHYDQIERYGGSHGVRDAGLLEAALYRPRTGYYVDLIEEASALWESLAQNHPLIDGNKRTAFAATYTFLAINGASITADAQAAYTFISRLYADNDFVFKKLAFQFSPAVSSMEVRQALLVVLRLTNWWRVATKSTFSRSGTFEKERPGGMAESLISRPSN